MTTSSFLGHPIADLARRLDKRRARTHRRRGARDVARLDDHMLRDIGITRQDAERAARSPPSESADLELRTLGFERHRRL